MPTVHNHFNHINKKTKTPQSELAQLIIQTAGLNSEKIFCNEIKHWCAPWRQIESWQQAKQKKTLHLNFCFPKFQKTFDLWAMLFGGEKAVPFLSTVQCPNRFWIICLDFFYPHGFWFAMRSGQWMWPFMRVLVGVWCTSEYLNNGQHFDWACHH